MNQDRKIALRAPRARNGQIDQRFLNSTKAHRDSGPKFALIAVATGQMNTLMVYEGVDILGRSYLLVQVAATVTVFLLNFVLNSVWTFRESDAT